MSLTVRIAMLSLFTIFARAALAEGPVFYGLPFPDAVAGFPRGKVIDYEKDHPGLGYKVPYSGNGWLVDVYIYNGGNKDLPNSLSADVVVHQFEQARGDIYTFWVQRKAKVEDKGLFTIAGPDHKARFICGTYLIDDGGAMDSFLCLTVWNGEFVKYRLTTLSSNGSAAVAERFVSSWTKLLWP